MHCSRCVAREAGAALHDVVGDEGVQRARGGRTEHDAAVRDA